jgi:hypothetical protein
MKTMVKATCRGQSSPSSAPQEWNQTALQEADYKGSSPYSSRKNELPLLAVSCTLKSNAGIKPELEFQDKTCTSFFVATPLTVKFSILKDTDDVSQIE